MVGSAKRWRGVFSALTVVAVVGGLLTLSSPAQSAFPGSNGKIVFRSDRTGDDEIFIMNADGSNQVQLTDDGSGNKNPSWNADGTKIVYTSDTNNSGDQGDITVMNPDGTGKQQLTDDDDTHPHFCPDGRIVFQREVVAGFADIFIMNGNGTVQANLTNTPAVDETMPACSPDGTKIAFANQTADTIETMNLDGTGRTTIVPDIGDPKRPDWSPNPHTIVFHNDGGTEGIYTVPSDGSSPPTLISGVSEDRAPSYSPDGTKIAFWNDDSPDDIFVMNADGTNRVQLPGPAGDEDATPDWQPISAGPTPTPGDGEPNVAPAFTSCPAAVSAPVSNLLGFSIGNQTTFSVAASGSPTPSFSSAGPASLTDNGNGTADLTLDPNLGDWLFDFFTANTQSTTASNKAGTDTCTTNIDIVLFEGSPFGG